MDEYLTLSETAELLGKSKETLRRWDRTGKLSAVREPVSNYRVYRKADVMALFAGFVGPEVEESYTNHAVPNKAYNVLELFAGAGGLAVGLEKAA